MLAALARPSGWGALHRPITPAMVQAWVEEADVEGVRRLWRALRGFTALDPACRDGRWLLGVSALLEPLRLAVIERMRSLLDEARSGPRRRPEYLSDLANVVDAAGDREADPGGRIHVRRSLLRENLFAIAPTARAEERCTRALARYGALEDGLIPLLDLNIRRAAPGERLGDGRRAGSSTMEAHEEAEILRTTVRMLRAHRAAGDCPAAGLRRACDEVGTRFAALGTIRGAETPALRRPCIVRPLR